MVIEPGTSALAPLILIVEDDLGTRLMYRDLLSHSGFRTVDAHNGHQALDKARALHPHAVITDLALPGIDGFEFCRALRQASSTQHIPIIAITGHPEYLAQPARWREAGITHVLTKPCPDDVLIGVLRGLLVSQPHTMRAGSPL
jgi:two-component system, cell cycle response regulator DivK